ncbi:MAG: YCF48-related protein [Calditrichia bacterium]
MRNLISFLMLVVFSTILSAQGWEWQNPKPSGNALTKMQFVGNNEYVLTENEELLKYDENFDVQRFEIPVILPRGIAFLDENVGYSVGIFGEIVKTTDCGQTWETISSPTRKRLNAITFNGNGIGIAVGDSGAIIRSNDFGNSWTPIGSTTEEWLTTVTFLDDSTGMAAGRNGTILRTEDAGQNWQLNTLPELPDINFVFNSHEVYFDSTSLCFCEDGITYYSQDFGKTWTRVTPISTEDLLGAAISPNGDMFAVGENGTLIKSTDRGINWQNIVIGTAATLYSIGFFANGNGMIGSDFGQVFRTEDGGGSWGLLQPDIIRSTLQAIFFISVLKGWAVGGDGNILVTTDGGLTWVKQTSGVAGFINDIHFIDENKGFAVGGVFGVNATVLRTVDGGATWTPVNTPAFNTLFSITFVDSQRGFMCGVDGQLLFTADCGVTWFSLFSGTTNWLLDIQFPSPTTGYIVGGNGTVLKTSDGGSLWTPRFSGTSEWLQSVTFLDDTTGMTAGNGGVILRTEDGGQTWEDRSPLFAAGNDFSEMNLDFFLQKSGQQDVQGIAVGANGMLAFTSDGGLTWEEQSSGTSNDLFGLALLPDGSAYICGDGGSILYSSAVTVGVEPLETLDVVTDYLLQQNYPNPFNPETIIRFYLPNAENVRLIVYDVLGRRVRELVNENLAAGSFQTTWDGTNDFGHQVSSGVYVYRLIGNGIVESRKMMLLR